MKQCQTAETLSRFCGKCGEIYKGEMAMDCWDGVCFWCPSCEVPLMEWLDSGLENRVRLWDAINAYAEACGGRPSGEGVYGNLRRQECVCEIEKIISDMKGE